MKKYYIHDGEDEQGPYNIEELKSKKINSTTPVWHNGLSNWTEAGKVDELNILLASVSDQNFIPPPRFENQQNQQVKNTAKPKSKSRGKRIFLFSLMAIFIVIAVGYINRALDTSNYSGNSESYQEKIMTVEEMEQAEPTRFLSAHGQYRENFWGDKLKIKGTIQNAATVASYKDALVRVTYYTKTETVLGNSTHTVYEIFQPKSTSEFELEIDNYKDVHRIGLVLISASAIY